MLDKKQKRRTYIVLREIVISQRMNLWLLAIIATLLLIVAVIVRVVIIGEFLN